MKKFLTSIEMAANTSINNAQLVNAGIEVLAAAPASPKTGRLYLNSTDSTPYLYNGTAWVSMNGTEALASLTAVASAIRGEFAAGDVATLATATTAIGVVSAAVSTEAGARAAADIVLAGSVTTLAGQVTSDIADAFAGAVDDAAAYTDAAVAGIIDAAPAALNTLNELAAALGDDANFATTVMNQISSSATTAGHGLSKTGTELSVVASVVVADVRAAMKATATIGDGSAESFTVTHNLGTTDISVTLYEVATNAQVEAGVSVVNANSITVSTGAIASASVRVVVIG